MSAAANSGRYQSIQYFPVYREPIYRPPQLPVDHPCSWIDITRDPTYPTCSVSFHQPPIPVVNATYQYAQDHEQLRRQQEIATTVADLRGFQAPVRPRLPSPPLSVPFAGQPVGDQPLVPSGAVASFGTLPSIQQMTIDDGTTEEPAAKRRRTTM
jgi:hypothetical protein